MKKYKITASIVLYNTCITELSEVLESLRSSKLEHKIYLIDNSPTDKLRKQIPNSDETEYIFNNKNIGFGSGHNIAIKKTQNISKYHLILNSDVKFQSDILQTMYDYMEVNKEVGLLAPKILNYDGSIQYSSKLLPTPINLIIRRFVPIKVVQDYFDYKYELKFSNFDKIVNVPYVMGCFMFVRCEVFNEIGGFDERFFMYPEDIDLTRRINQKYKTLYFPKTVIYHKHGKGSYKSNRLLYYHVTSMIKYFNKWGWIFDTERREINKRTLSQFH